MTVGFFALFLLSVREVLRSRGFLAGTVCYAALCAFLSYAIGTSGPAEDAVRFYVVVAWFLFFLYAVAVSAVLPLRLFSREKRERLGALLAVRPVSRLCILLARFAASLSVAACVLLSGCLILYAGVRVIASRRQADLSFLRGCVQYGLPPRGVAGGEVAKLAQELSRDPAFVAQHGPEGVRAVARRSLSVWRVGSGGSVRVRFQGIPTRVNGARLRVVPRVYPPWSDAEADFLVGKAVVHRLLRPDVPLSLDLPGGIDTESGDLQVGVRVTRTGDPRALVSFVPPEGIEVFVPQISFLANLLRAALLALTVAAGLSCFGLLAGVALSPPAGVLAGVTVIVLGLGSTFFTEAVAEFTKAPSEEAHAEVGSPVARAVGYLWYSVLGAALKAPPNLGAFDPSRHLVEGRIIPWRVIARQALLNSVLRGGVALGAAFLIFRRREVGRRA